MSSAKWGGGGSISFRPQYINFVQWFNGVSSPSFSVCDHVDHNARLRPSQTDGFDKYTGIERRRAKIIRYLDEASSYVMFFINLNL